jgi:UDPglucose 6-dehydrogenase
MAQKIINACGGSVQGKTIGLLGLAFKPNTDDMRDAPSIVIVEELLKAGAQIKAYDPESMNQAQAVMPKITFCHDAYSSVQDSDALVIVTEWDAFRALDLDRVKAGLKTPIVIDLRNIYRSEDLRRRGFTYVSIGRN